MRRSRKDWAETIERLLAEAVRTLRFLDVRGARPAGYRSTGPEPVRLQSESYGWDKAKVVRFAPTSAAISRYDFIQGCVSAAPLTAKQRDLLWARAERRRWKELAFACGLSVRSAQRQHSKALAELCAYIIAKNREALAHKTSSQNLGRLIRFR